MKNVFMKIPFAVWKNSFKVFLSSCIAADASWLSFLFAGASALTGFHRYFLRDAVLTTILVYLGEAGRLWVHSWVAGLI